MLYTSIISNPPPLLSSTIGIGNDNDASKDDVNNNDTPNKEDAVKPKEDHKETIASNAKPKAAPTKKPPAKVAHPNAKNLTIALYSLDVRDAAIIAPTITMRGSTTPKSRSTSTV